MLGFGKTQSIKLERDNWVRQRVPPKMAVALSGDLKLRKRPHQEFAP